MKPYEEMSVSAVIVNPGFSSLSCKQFVTLNFSSQLKELQIGLINSLFQQLSQIQILGRK